MNEEIKLDIGCGRRPLEGWTGLDIVGYDGIIQYDMTKQQLPFKDDTVTAIRCINTLEHVERKYYRFIFNDWYRALKLNGTVEIIVPNFLKDADHALSDITHVSLWVPNMVRYLSGERPRYADYGFLPWEVVQNKNFEKENRDLHIILRTKINRKTGIKYEL